MRGVRKVYQQQLNKKIRSLAGITSEIQLKIIKWDKWTKIIVHKEHR